MVQLGKESVLEKKTTNLRPKGANSSKKGRKSEAAGRESVGCLLVVITEYRVLFCSHWLSSYIHVNLYYLEPSWKSLHLNSTFPTISATMLVSTQRESSAAKEEEAFEELCIAHSQNTAPRRCLQKGSYRTSLKPTRTYSGTMYKVS